MLLYPSYELAPLNRADFPSGTIYNADCLEALKSIPDRSVDCVITDPPYFLGMTHNGKKGNFRDLSICRPFYRELFKEFLRVCKPEACVYFFCDWRGYAFYYPIFDEILKAHNMLVWNKLSGPGNHYAFIHELVLFHAGKGANIGGTNIISDIKSFAAGAKTTDGEKVHPTQKPVELIAKFIEDSTPPQFRNFRHLRRLWHYSGGSGPDRSPLYPDGAGRRVFFYLMQTFGR